MRIGISIYPHLIKKNDEIIKYLENCRDSEVKIIFTTLISIKKEEEELLTLFKKLTDKAKELGMIVCCDVNNDVYKEFSLHKSSRDETIEFFYEKLGINYIRFDEGINAEFLAKLSNNDKDIKIILNASDPLLEINYFVAMGGNKNNLLTCWNFYPQRYTGSSIEFFKKQLSYIKKNGIPIQAFVASQEKDTKGPWEYNDKLPTLEFHRDLNLDFQIRHLISMNVNDVIVSSQYLKSDELKMIKNINKNKISIRVKEVKNISKNEKKILYDQEIHSVRMDLTDYMHRSTWSRLKYKNLDIKPNKVKKDYFNIGDVVILNNDAKNYKGELQIILRKMKNSGIRNLVGTLDTIEQEIVHNLTSNSEFIFIPSHDILVERCLT